ncbi:DUF6355 family natural product biosynthesis protein [Streptosporangium roseum]|uniref:DUF6355 family natural product biosynthesis protein n=1 Tax=Streptosporangium roseum TaxID=2001 RepID=UPI0033338461
MVILASTTDRSRLRAVSAVASAVLVAGMMATSASPAHAAPVNGLTVQQESADAPRCGFFINQVRETRFAVYGHCGPTTILVHVDVSGGGSTNDYHLCVGPGNTLLGYYGNILNAYYIGGAGCRRGDRTGHTPH